jgi:hypothetical protein
MPKQIIDLALHLKMIQKTGESLFHSNDGHMNAKGHAVTADAIHKQLKSKSSVDP